MNVRHARSAAVRSAPQPVHLGPQARAQSLALQSAAGPNAALLIDFDNVTLGIQKDLGKELRSLLGSDIIKGKVSVQRAYADWRRYPQYILPLAESSIDMIMAPAYGSAKKNATDIRLAIDAVELVFTRPEIGTFILLSGDSDFSSLVLKLKEYGKYVIGVGIRESASDLLVQNCDEYYSYNALAGLSKAAEEAPVKRDPWELVAEAIGRMTRQGDVMRSDRLKQVMQELDPSFDEKDLGYSKFSRFATEAAAKGLLSLTKLENGQLEVGAPGASAPASATGASAAAGEGAERPEREGRGRRGRRGRGRGRDRERERDVTEATGPESAASPEPPAATPDATPAVAHAEDAIGHGGELLTRDETFDLVRRAVERLVAAGETTTSEAVRREARSLLGRDSQSLALRFFDRILKDASEAGHIALSRADEGFVIGRAVPRVDTAPQAATGPRGLGPRGIPGGRGRKGAPPPELLMVGVVEEHTPLVAAPEAASPVEADAADAAPAKPARTKRGRALGKTAKAPKSADAPAAEKKSRGRGRKKATSQD